MLAKRLATRQAADVPSNVFAGAAHTGALAIEGVMLIEVRQQEAADLLHQRLGQVLAGGQVVRDFAKYPRAALRGAANHQRVCAGEL